MTHELVFFLILKVIIKIQKIILLDLPSPSQIVMIVAAILSPDTPKLYFFLSKRMNQLLEECVLHYYNFILLKFNIKFRKFSIFYF